MAKNLGRAARESVICLAGCVGFCETLLDSEIPVYKASREYLTQCKEAANAVMDNILREADDDQAVACMRQAANCQLTVMPNSDVRNNKELLVADRAALEELLDDVISDCAFCIKSEQEAKKCKRRKNLIAVGLIGTNERGCPYAG